MTRKRQTFFILYLLAAMASWAQAPEGTGTYYQSADGKKGKALKTALFGIIQSPNVSSYKQLWECYKETDLKPNGKIWDMYSNMTDYDPDNDRAGSYSKEGDVFNREHSFPKSWFSEASPMYSDLFHVVPTDGYVNGRRSNYPFGETNGESYSSNGGFSKVGKCTVSGYSGTVFEPNDEYKGDFARIYFYMATCYEDRIGSWSSDMLSGDSYTAYAQWALDMLLRWAAEDPVSQKEKDRNNAVYGIQGNRNPYVDYPGLEQYVWGTMTDKAFSYDNYAGVIDGPDPDPDPEPEPEPDPQPGPIDGEQTYTKVMDTNGIETGSGYLIVYENTDATSGYALGGLLENGKAHSAVSVTIADGTIVTSVNDTALPHDLLLGGTPDAYTFYDTCTDAYLSLPSSDNCLKQSEEVQGTTEQWTLNVSNGTATLKNNNYTNREIRYNTGSPRFACYTSGSQSAVSLYKRNSSTGIASVQDTTDNDVNVYTVYGTCVRRNVPASTCTDGLKKGIYIVKGHKIAVR